jgi:CTP-dependent riboflavin kinase
MLIRGHIVGGLNHFQRRIARYRGVFKEKTGQELFPGTLNVKIAHQIKVREDFRIQGTEINEAQQDLIFERCKINGIEGFRIRPFNLKTGLGGHGDDTLEIACAERVPCVGIGTEVEIELFRE